MCGIVGVISNCSNGFTQKEADAFSDLLFLDTLRGFDSTGVMGIDNSGNVTVIKEASHALDFMGAKEYKDLRGDMIRRGKFLVGHNRAATRGTVVDKNAHPFVIDDKIVLMQNGTYKGSHHHHKVTDVDTEAVAHVIAESDSIEKALQSINASYTLAWYNADEYKLNLVRNDERPMWVAYFGLSGVMFASEPDFIIMAAGRNDIKLKDAPYPLKPGMLTSFKLNLKGSYEFAEEQLDHKYKAPPGQTQTYQLGMDCAYSPHRPTVHRVTPPANVTPIAVAATTGTNDHRAFGAGGVREMKFDFVSLITKRRPSYLFDTQEQAEAEVTRLADVIHNGYHYVELIDFIPANDHKNCEVFHIYGAVMDPNGLGDGPMGLVHWITYGKSEEDVLDDITKHTFYKVKLSTNITRRVKVGEEMKYLQTAFAVQHDPVQSVALVQ